MRQIQDPFPVPMEYDLLGHCPGAANTATTDTLPELQTKVHTKVLNHGEKAPTRAFSFKTLYTKQVLIQRCNCVTDTKVIRDMQVG